MELFPKPTVNTRLGFHYYPDTLHYRESDLNAWLPELHALGATWLTLVTPHDRAIPEQFIRGLVTLGIEPVLHFHLPLERHAQINDLRLLFHTYARWGAHYVVLFDRPNLRTSWPATAWVQSNLVERFLDVYLPLAQAALQAGLVPVFPPLEPGGDYWDTAFLRGALQGLQRRGQTSILKRLVIGAYAWASNRSLNWGAGGPERWPGARPYHTPQGSQDQRGFRIFDWYLAQVRSVAEIPCAILLLGAGSRLGDQADPSLPPVDRAAHAKSNLSIAALMSGVKRVPGKSLVDLEGIEDVPSEVLACNFWLIAATRESLASEHAWFQADGNSLPVTGALRQWVTKQGGSREPAPAPAAPLSAAPYAPQYSPLSAPQYAPQRAPQCAPPSVPHSFPNRAEPSRYPHRNGHSIQHYLLLPTYEWGIADWHLDVIRPFVKKYRPTIGFSLKEAAQAARVTIIGGAQSFPEAVLEELRSANCTVEQISGDGTSIASQLATL
jgi:hypothetical protein